MSGDTGESSSSRMDLTINRFINEQGFMTEPPKIVMLFDFSVADLKEYISWKGFSPNNRGREDLLKLAISLYHEKDAIYSRLCCQDEFTS